MYWLRSHCPSLASHVNTLDKICLAWLVNSCNLVL
ncbi:hypothetical protein SAMN05421595_2143 [Austwickia chelonae]|nr:hypothetical protein SAMN05421595_2143 [Austwickia chelonae]